MIKFGNAMHYRTQPQMQHVHHNHVPQHVHNHALGYQHQHIAHQHVQPQMQVTQQAGMGLMRPGFGFNPWGQYQIQQQLQRSWPQQQPFLQVRPQVQPVYIQTPQQYQVQAVQAVQASVPRQPLRLVITGDRLDMLSCGLGPIKMQALDSTTGELVTVMVEPRDTNPDQCRMPGRQVGAQQLQGNGTQYGYGGPQYGESAFVSEPMQMSMPMAGSMGEQEHQAPYSDFPDGYQG